MNIKRYKIQQGDNIIPIPEGAKLLGITKMLSLSPPDNSMPSSI